MAVITSKRMGSMMLMVALILWLSVGVYSDFLCRAQCINSCGGNYMCMMQCVRSCNRPYYSESLTFAALEHCDAGCFMSTCLDNHPDTKKVGVDMKKVEACANSCTQGCKKTYSLQ
ncbi:hypothetical protein ACJRO7_030898 [Eucalyptus globulus]|uniref:Thionin-like protein 2 n=1 Tax=Eucalyptus globulus TaxID=34317 RepID=A0ABD3JF43_EUCGL